MPRGPLYALSKRAAFRALAGCLFLVAVCAGVLAVTGFVTSRWWTGPVVWVFAPALGFSLLLTCFAASERLRPHRSIVFTGLKRYGDPAAIAAQVDDELSISGADVRDGTIWLTRSWMIGLVRPGVFRLADLVAVGIGPINMGQWRIVCWPLGEDASHTFEVSPAEAQRIQEALRLSAPGLVVVDIDGFDARWKADRLVVEAAALARGRTAEPPTARIA